MLGKPLSKNLQYFFSTVPSITSFQVPVVLFDRNTTKTLPCITIGYSEERMSWSGSLGHYTVSGYTTIEVQGYEDQNNDLADDITTYVLSAINGNPALYNKVNKPSTGTDSRPVSAFHLNELFVRSVDREIDGNSMCITINYDAFCVAQAV